MNRLWKIELYIGESGKGIYYKTVIQGEAGNKAIGKGPTPHLSYMDAECKLIVKPWLKSTINNS